MYCLKLQRLCFFVVQCVCKCVCAQHENLGWLCAMQLEAIIEPITFCLLLSLSFPPFSLSLSYVIPPCSYSVHLSDFNSLGLTPCFTVNPFTYTFSCL